MSDPSSILALLIPGSLAALAAAYYFKTLDAGLWREARVPMIAGLVSGTVLSLLFDAPPRRIAAAGLVLTASALYTRLTGRESEPSEGMVLGAITGTVAAIPLALAGDDALIRFAECTLAGAVAGGGITLGVTHIRDRARQFGLDSVTALLSVGAAYLPQLASGAGVADLRIALFAAALVPLLVVLNVFRLWPAVRAELGGESALGIVQADDVAPTAHPLRRLGRAGWHDAGAHRQFVRLATRIALRKRQQRGRSEDVARLYQLEVIKLRMQLQETALIDRAMRSAVDRQDA